MKPEDRVSIAVSMIDACARVCVDSIRDTDPDITEEELLDRARFRFSGIKQQHHEG